MTEYIQINKTDNVAVALKDLTKGSALEISGNIITTNEDIPAGHKIALKDFLTGDLVIKYGFPIGHTTTDVKTGCLINEKNIKTNLSGVATYSYTPHFRTPNFNNEGRS